MGKQPAADVVDELTESQASPPDAPPPDAPAPDAPTRQGFRIKLLVLGAVLLVGAAVAWFYFHSRNRVSSDDAQVDSHISAIAPKVSGTVLEVPVRDNQSVKAGQILVRIDPRDYQAKVDMARAALQQAE